jgi:AcrR family transcriptional regulator
MTRHVKKNSSTTATRLDPQQARAQATLEKLEEAIRSALRDPNNGRDRFTTVQIAEIAGVSVGTVYRYFDNRLAMLDHVWPDRNDVYLPHD